MDIWKTLVWKEWEEHKWKLLALVAIIMSVYLAMLSDEITLLPNDATHVLFALNCALAVYSVFAPLFVGMGVCAAERSNRSIEFIRAQPIDLQEAARTRFIAGAIVIAVPILCCFVCSMALVLIWPDSKLYVATTGLPDSWNAPFAVAVFSAMALGGSLNTFAWISAAAVNQRTEFRAGLIGLIVIVTLIFVGSIGLAGWDNRIREGEVSIPYLVALISTPLAYLAIPDFVRNSRSEYIFFALVWQAVLTAKLANVVVRRYGGDEWFANWFDRVEPREHRSHDVLRRPFRTPWLALFWLQMRQTVPVGLVGLAIVFLTAFVVAPFHYNPIGLCGFVGSILALIIGVGSFVHELEPKLHTFWRSRPISASSWFWLKFAAGLFVLVVMFDLPYFLLAWAKLIYPWSAYRPAFAPQQHTEPSLFAALFPVLLHLMVYSLGVLAACSIRHSVYSTVFAVCAVLAIIMVPEVSWASLPQWLSLLELWYGLMRVPVGLYPVSYFWAVAEVFVVATGLVSAIAIPATLLAHALIKRDIALNT